MDVLELMLWISLAIMTAGALLPKKYGYKVAAAGWVIFGIRWGLSTPEYYLVDHNIMYTTACILAIPVTLYFAFVMVKDERESLMVLTKSAVISGIFYFPFAYIPWLSDWFIQFTTSITLGVVRALGENAVLTTFNGVVEGISGTHYIIMLNNEPVEIILACTAIQSMALFVGLVGCIKAPWDRKFKAFMVSVPVIYLLNLVRNTFVISAYGNQWLQIIPGTIAGWTGEPPSYASFFWSHNVLAEAGSLIALVAISYAVIMILPETLAYLSDIFSLVTWENIKKNLRGEKVPVIAPAPLQSKK
jgi:archaeosortase A (PGF-CTERM-specific)